MSDVDQIDSHISQGKWGDPRVPKRGWVCEGIDDLGAPDATCEMCETQDIRYVHYMSHPLHPEVLGCGCVCSGYMEEDIERARIRERAVRSRAGRRKAWPRLKGWHRSERGNRTIVKDGFRVTIVSDRGLHRILVTPPGASSPVRGSKTYSTEDAAVVASFEGLMWVKEKFKA